MEDIRVGYKHLMQTVRHAELRPLGFYAVIFSTTDTGVEQTVNSFVAREWQSLDALIGAADSLCFAIADNLDVRRRQDVYLVARELGVPFEALPAMAFFAQPADLRKVMYVRLGEFLDDDADDDQMWRLFRGIADAIVRATDVSSTEKRAASRRRAKSIAERRLDALAEEWKSGFASQRDDYLGHVAATTGQLAETASHGRTIADALTVAARAVQMLT
jgi:hypothetical protein